MLFITFKFGNKYFIRLGINPANPEMIKSGFFKTICLIRNGILIIEKNKIKNLDILPVVGIIESKFKNFKYKFLPLLNFENSPKMSKK